MTKWLYSKTIDIERACGESLPVKIVFVIFWDVGVVHFQWHW